MISVEQAKKIILSHCRPLPATLLPVEEAVGYVLAQDVTSPVNIPGFRQSSMDGYAIRYIDRKEILPLADSLPAGTAKQIVLAPHTAVKVFTGGPVPDGADTVVQKEWIQENEKGIQVTREETEQGMHIRMPGADIRKDTIVLTRSTQVTAMHAGLLSSIGLERISVIAKPRVSIVITGNELVQPGEELQYGQVYESNSFSLKACLRQMNVKNISVFFAKDDPAQTESAIAKASQAADIVLLTGGVSVGDYDYVAAACTAQGIIQQLHGVKQRPGKPLFFGIKQHQLVFGLPGNPASVLSCFYQYVMPAIQVCSGMQLPEPRKAMLDKDFEKKPPLTFFLKGMVSGERVIVEQAQASFQLSAFANANCWIELPEEQSFFSAGTEVIIHPFI